MAAIGARRRCEHHAILDGRRLDPFGWDQLLRTRVDHAVLMPERGGHLSQRARIAHAGQHVPPQAPGFTNATVEHHRPVARRVALSRAPGILEHHGAHHRAARLQLVEHLREVQRAELGQLHGDQDNRGAVLLAPFEAPRHLDDGVEQRGP
jgi:hypothetical protein